MAGFYAPGQPVEPWFAAATEVARHRGPDGDGAWSPGWAAREPLARVADGTAPTGRDAVLGFVRLSILDLAPTGSQPMVAEGRAAVVLNGEIYNYVELRDELVALGWTFTSTGDCEVLLKGWLAWREGLFARLNGMWAIALYDAERDAIVLSRDRFGEKPLYWTDWRGGVAFASEAKQLFGFPDIAPRLNLERAAGYIRTGRPYFGASSWFEGLHQLEPGSNLVVDRSGHRRTSYWNLSNAVAKVERSADPASWQRRFAESFSTSIRIRLRSDVPVGTSLSGGVDSSAVMAEATALGHAGYHSFTVTSDDRHVNEGREAGKFASVMGSTWHPIHVSGEDFARTWDKLTWHQECPVPTTSLYGQWKVMEAARAAGVIVLLDGQGADEILGGYHKFLAAVLLGRIRSHSLSAVPFAVAFGRHLGGPRTILEAGHRYLGRFGGGPDVSSWLRVRPDIRQTTPSIGGKLLTMQLSDIETWSLPNLLSYADRNSMAFGVEGRLPYLDPDLAVLALAMPDDVLARGGWSKWPLRQTLADLGGGEPAWRRGKRWFGVPQRQWLRGPLADHVNAWRREPHPLWAEVLDVSAMRRHGDAWATAPRTNSAADSQIFELVALDRHLRTWFAT
ncbi:MAG TPA: asparagine synthase (glutamine-hydrolyzing) [Candidatus Limnocylindrales bacterium]